MTDWWWKVGFTPRAIRHVHPYWQLSSSCDISSYLWILSFKLPAVVRIHWEHFKNTPFSVLRRPPLVFYPSLDCCVGKVNNSTWLITQGMLCHTHTHIKKVIIHTRKHTHEVPLPTHTYTHTCARTHINTHIHTVQ